LDTSECHVVTDGVVTYQPATEANVLEHRAADHWTDDGFK